MLIGELCMSQLVMCFPTPCILASFRHVVYTPLWNEGNVFDRRWRLTPFTNGDLHITPPFSSSTYLLGKKKASRGNRNPAG